MSAPCPLRRVRKILPRRGARQPAAACGPDPLADVGPTKSGRELRDLWRIEAEHQRLEDVFEDDEHPVVCPFCGRAYALDSPDGRKNHLLFHQCVASTLPPRPDKRISALRLGGCDLRVDSDSPRWMHRLVYERARRLKREEHYDMPQWQPDSVAWQWSREEPTPPHAFLLIEQGDIAVGVVGFINRQRRREVAPGWHMLFAWVAPEWRRQGVLTRRWSAWRSAYGDFTLEPPLSNPMKAFAAKISHPTEPHSGRNWLSR
jgi:hypothetical protein